MYINEQIFKELPPSLQGDICKNMFENIIDKIEFLKGKPKNFIRKLFKLFKPIFLNAGDELYHKGEISNEIYFVIQGRVVTKFNNNIGETKSLVLVEGSYFGEVDVIFKRERAENAFSEDRCEIWKVFKDDFINLLDDFENIKEEVVNSAVEKDKFMFQSNQEEEPQE